ncbi:MAG: hypothetical protein F4X96_08645 [Gammaproteobacteria bacterium]|nr:hypothetical protein [Chromatiales bacterium]MYE49487.1 hypothetical protein [Gammaproteobacteria bacterium]MYI37230.1 hypothetical protein [Acidimicrobiaceae bacterium]
MRDGRPKAAEGRRDQIEAEGLRRVSATNPGRDRLLAGRPIVIGGRRRGGIRVIWPGTPEADEIIRRG